MTELCCNCTFPDIDPAEVRVLTFDFANGLPSGVTLASATLDVSSSGQDPLPSSRFSSPQIDGALVLVTVDGAQEGNTYHLRAIAPTTDAERTLVIGADITCRLL